MRIKSLPWVLTVYRLPFIANEMSLHSLTVIIFSAKHNVTRILCMAFMFRHQVSLGNLPRESITLKDQ